MWQVTQNFNKQKQKKMKFKKFKNVASSNSNGSFNSIEEALDFIRGNRPDLEKVAELRTYEKGSAAFKNLKTQMPCVMWNFQSAGRRSIQYATESTGFLYFDIDNVEQLNLNRDYVFASWKSISETGFGLLIRVEGVDKNNFKFCYDDVTSALGIKYDKGTNDLTRLNILSLDKDLYYNPNCEVFDFTGVELLEESFEENTGENSQPIDQNIFSKSGEWSDRLPLLRMSNIEEKMAEKQFKFDENGVCDLMDDKLGYTEVYIPGRITEGSRNYQLLAIAIKLVVLNPSATSPQIIAFLNSINKLVCTVPKTDSEIKHIVETVFKDKNKLYLKSNKTKRFFFNNPDLSLSEKRSLVMTYVNRHRAVIRREEICDCMAQMEEEKTIYKISEIMKRCKASRSTVNDILAVPDRGKLHYLRRKNTHQTGR